jgi:hypothetical protein
MRADRMVRVVLAHPSKHSQMGMGFARMKAGAILVKSLRVVTRSLVILLCIPAALFARAISLQEALLSLWKQIPISRRWPTYLLLPKARSRAPTTLVSSIPSCLAKVTIAIAARSNSQEWRGRLLQQLEILGQPALRRRSAAIGYQGTQAHVRNEVRLLTASVKMTFYDATRERERSELLQDLENSITGYSIRACPF